MKAIEKLKIEIKTNNRKDVIESFEEIIASAIKNSPVFDDFFSLPFNNIPSIVSKMKFQEEDKDDEDSIFRIKSLISKILAIYPEKRETLLLLSSLQTQDLEMNLDSCNT